MVGNDGSGVEGGPGIGGHFHAGALTLADADVAIFSGSAGEGIAGKIEAHSRRIDLAENVGGSDAEVELDRLARGAVSTVRVAEFGDGISGDVEVENRAAVACGDADAPVCGAANGIADDGGGVCTVAACFDGDAVRLRRAREGDAGGADEVVADKAIKHCARSGGALDHGDGHRGCAVDGVAIDVVIHGAIVAGDAGGSGDGDALAEAAGVAAGEGVVLEGDV